MVELLEAAEEGQVEQAETYGLHTIVPRDDAGGAQEVSSACL